MIDMYPGVEFSAKTATKAAINEADTRIYVTDPLVFGEELPMLATLFESDEGGEIVLVESAGTDFVDVVRGVNSTARLWPNETLMARLFTAKDLNDLQTNVRDLFNKADTTKGAVDSLSTDVAVLKTGATSLGGRLTDVEDAAEVMSRNIASLDSRVTTSEATANNAATTAGQAKTTADTAKSTADTAKSTADTAKSTADTAKTTADSAATTAGEAKTTARAAIDDAAAAGDMAAAANAAARAVTVNGIPQVVEEGESTGDIPITATDLPTSPIEGLTAQDVQGALAELNEKARSVRRDITILQADWVEIDDGFTATIMDESVTENTYIDVIFGRAAAALCPAGIYDRALDEGQSQVAGQYTLVTDEMPEGDISGVAILKEVSEDAD